MLAPAAPGPFLRLPLFDGPLDLLLHLCRRHELSVAQLPIGEITAQFLAYLEVMEELQIEVAGEFVEMAALLCLLKSRELLPRTDLAAELEDDEVGDPRAALVARLLEYRRYREAAMELDDRPSPGVDFFARAHDPRASAGLEDSAAPIDADLTALLSALRDLLEDRASAEPIHAAPVPQIRVEDCMRAVLERLADSDRPRLDFRSAFDPEASRARVVVTFLAILELARLRWIRIGQRGHLRRLVLERRFQGAPPAVQELPDG